MNADREISKLKNQGATLRYVVLSIAAAGVLGTVFFAGGREGYGYGYHKAIATIRAAVQASQYPVVDITYPGHQAVSITVGDVCKPYPSRLPAFYHAVIVSPMYQPCGQPADGQPYRDSAALAAITRAVQK